MSGVRAFALALPALLAACGGAAPDTEASDPAAGATPSPQASPGELPGSAEPRAVVYAQGVSFGSRRLPFRTERSVIEREARAVFPQAQFTIDRNDECGAGPMDFAKFGPLTLNFQNDRLVGWYMEQGPGMVTSDGISPGLTIGDLRQERSVAWAEDSTLDGEFSYAAPDGNTIGGFAKGEGDAAVITALYAGTNCFFR